MPFRSMYARPTDAKYLFVDGGCLREILKDYSAMYFGGIELDFDYKKLAKPFTKVFYYDGFPAQKQEEPYEEYRSRIMPYKQFFDSLGTTDKIHVNLGSVHKGKRGRLEQKQVDTMLSIEMLNHAYKGNMQEATLLAVDSDFIPVVDAMVQNGMNINLWFADTKNCHPSTELIASADMKRQLRITDIFLMCSAAFMKKFSLPQMTGLHTDQVENASAINGWDDAIYGKMQLYTGKMGYTLVFRSEDYSNHFTHPNLELLRAYVSEMYGIVIP